MDSNSNGSQQQVVVVGSSFAGLTAALELRKHLDRQHRVVVLDRRPDFTFIPSLVWLPFGKRRPEDITFPHHGPIPPARVSRRRCACVRRDRFGPASRDSKPIVCGEPGKG